jgi:D-alanine-D-alanine ligase-like ATP-grasp enzyme
MRVCILSDEDFEDFDPSYYFNDYEWEMVNVKVPALDFIRRLSRKKEYDVYLNLCTGAGEEELGLDVVQALELLNLPFTGADSRFYDPTREQMQAVAEIQGIGFARGFHAESVYDLWQAKGLRYPLMVKHPNSYGSMGMTRDSRVESPAQLRKQVQRLCSEFGSARVEEFIEGREFTCMVVDNPEQLSEPFAYPPAEVLFPNGESFQHTEVKWESCDTRLSPVLESHLADRLQVMSKMMYLGLGGVGYGRTDIRMTPDGELTMLEINPNCGILYLPEENGPADVPIEYDRDGHAGFLERIFRSAMLRQQMRIPVRTRARQYARV